VDVVAPQRKAGEHALEDQCAGPQADSARITLPNTPEPGPMLTEAVAQAATLGKPSQSEIDALGADDLDELRGRGTSIP
jgi:hypothetical protein